MKLIPYWEMPRGQRITMVVKGWIAIDAETYAQWERADRAGKQYDSPIAHLSSTHGRAKAGNDPRYFLTIKTCNLLPDMRPETVYLKFRAVNDEEAFSKAVARLDQWQKASI